MAGGYQIKLNLSGDILNGRAGPELLRALRRDMQKIGFELENEVAQEIPEGATGEARRGVTHKMEANKLKMKIYESGPAKSYIEVLEQGRRAGKKQPSPRHLWKWLKHSSKGRQYVREAKAKYFSDHKTTSGFSEAKLLRQIAWMKSRSIGKYGTKAVKMFTKTFTKRKSWINNKLQGTVRRFTNGL